MARFSTFPYPYPYCCTKIVRLQVQHGPSLPTTVHDINLSWGLGVKGLGFRGLGFRVWGFRGLGFRGLGFRVWGFRGLGFRV